MISIDAINGKDTVAQMTRCSFDTHVQEIMGSLTIGATIVMLRPRGTIDFNYLSSVLHRKQITCMDTVPSLYYSLFTFIKESRNEDSVKYLRSLISGGM